MGNLDNLKMDMVVAVVHSDQRRIIYNPEKILRGLEVFAEQWYPHNIITLTQGGLELGKHHHDYSEVFFTPTGGFDFYVADSEDFQQAYRFVLNSGSRVLLPENVDHVVIGSSGAVLMGYGNIEFDPKRLFPSSKEVLESLSRKAELPDISTRD